MPVEGDSFLYTYLSIYTLQLKIHLSPTPTEKEREREERVSECVCVCVHAKMVTDHHIKQFLASSPWPLIHPFFIHIEYYG